MGLHWLPRRYLRNFEVSAKPGFIWLYDKTAGDSRLVKIRQAAQSKDYYSPVTEKRLADVVERPANAVIKKIIEGKQPDVAERFRLALYVGTMLMRVPSRRRKALQMAPRVLDDTVADVRREITELQGKIPDVDSNVVDRRLAELKAAHTKFKRNLPEAVIQQIREPWPNKDIVDAIYLMNWRVLISAGPIYFITSDNPVFLAWGLLKPAAEMSFALSTTHALHGCWQKNTYDPEFLPVSQQYVKEINRRLVSNTERLAFFHERALWLIRILEKKDLRLNSMQW